MEVSQFTYFQQIAGIDCNPVTTELTYGLERLAMFVQGIDNIFELYYNHELRYGDIHSEHEKQYSQFNFDLANIETLKRHFEDCEQNVHVLCEQQCPLPAYDYCLKASHLFNLLDARQAVSVSERQAYIARVRNLTKLAAQTYLDIRS